MLKTKARLKLSPNHPTIISGNQHSTRPRPCFSITGRKADGRMLDINPHGFAIGRGGHTGGFTPSRPSQKVFHFRSGRIAAEHLIGAHIDVASG